MRVTMKMPDAPALARIEASVQASLALLERNLTPHGILAASPTEAAVARRYTRIFGRDAAICAMAMCGSGVAALEQGAVASLAALAAQQAANGQIPKYVDPEGRDADFWYLGCIDATLWWLIAVDHLRRAGSVAPTRWQGEIARAISWLLAQEHQHFRLLQQNEASDWADIMPRSGFVLYSNALWYRVKRLYGLPHAQRTRRSFNELFHPFSARLSEYRRARLLAGYPRRGACNRDLYLSFVNFSYFGEEGDVFGNLLAVLFGLADRKAGARVMSALEARRVDRGYPVRVACDPIAPRDPLWRDYMNRHRQNLAWQYHNGGIWPFVGGFWVAALAHTGETTRARHALAELARANALRRWEFNEWLHGRTLQPRGMPGQSWNAAAYLLAFAAVQRVAGHPADP